MLIISFNLIQGSSQTVKIDEANDNLYLMDHEATCKCGICLNAAARAQVLRTGFIQVFHQFLHLPRRSTLIDGDYATLYDYWKRYNLANDADTLFTIYLFIWKAHMQSASKKTGDSITRFLQRSQEKLRTLPSYDEALEIDISTKMTLAYRTDSVPSLPLMSRVLEFHDGLPKVDHVPSSTVSGAIRKGSKPTQPLFGMKQAGDAVDILEDILAVPVSGATLSNTKTDRPKSNALAALKLSTASLSQKAPTLKSSRTASVTNTKKVREVTDIENAPGVANSRGSRRAKQSVPEVNASIPEKKGPVTRTRITKRLI